MVTPSPPPQISENNLLSNNKPKLKIKIGKKAIKEVLPTKGNLLLFNSNSKEPSSTINIKPMVPNMGKIGVRSGIDIWTKLNNCFTEKPRIKSNITDGILVFDELKSKA